MSLLEGSIVKAVQLGSFTTHQAKEFRESDTARKLDETATAAGAKTKAAAEYVADKTGQILRGMFVLLLFFVPKGLALFVGTS